MGHEDETLVQMALARATGADIHDVKGVIGYYQAACWCLDRGPESKSQDKLARKMRMEGAATLSSYLIHGDIRRAKDENERS